MAITERDLLALAKESVFARTVVGVDGTEPGLEACRQAAVLAGPDGWLELCCAVHSAEAALAGWSATRLAEELEREGRDALSAAATMAGPAAATALLNGPATASLLQEVDTQRATLIALGTHGHSRASEIVLGGTAGGVLHEAPCSVLIARPPRLDGPFPHAIVAGVDGSPQAEYALAVAQDLAHSFHASLRVVCALHGKGVDIARVHLRTPSVETVDDHPLRALLRVSMDADLLVVGSRGLHGVPALGSVSERVAHQAGCSVLVVRDRRA